MRKSLNENKTVQLIVIIALLAGAGFLLMTQVRDIPWVDYDLAIPAFLTIVLMPFTYSIANGIGVGFIAWVLVNSVSGRAKQVSPLLWIVAALFVVFFARGPIEALLA